jgi:hypothetical protein
MRFLVLGFAAVASPAAREKHIVITVNNAPIQRMAAEIRPSCAVGVKFAVVVTTIH